MSFSVTVGSAVAANTGIGYQLMQVTWQATDGFHPIFGGTGPVGLFGPDSYNPPFLTLLTDLYLHADGSGNIDSWYFSAFNVPFAGSLVSESPDLGYASQVNTTNVSDYVLSRPTPFGQGDFAKAGVTNSGTWTMETVGTVTPEPATLTLFATGLLSVGVAARRRRRVG